MPVLTLRVLPESLAVARLPPAADVPSWALRGSFLSVTRTTRELSIVAPLDAVPLHARAERGWRALEVDGPLDFALTGILAALATPLSEAGVSIFAVSTFDTDYVLVRDGQLPAALDALIAAGHILG